MRSWNPWTPPRPRIAPALCRLACRRLARRAAFAALSSAVLLSGCASRQYDHADDSYWRNDPDAVLASYRDALEDDGKNALLGVEKMLSAALLRHDWTNAESLAIRASTLVNIFVAGEPGERDALSFFGREKDKPFKGEPYERAMADYYLGAIRFRGGDHEGALAAFRSAMQKDRGSFLLPVEREKAKKRRENVERYLYEDDYALLEILAAKCCQLLEEPEDAQKYLARAIATHPAMTPLFEEVMDPRTNVLVLVEAGRAPFKRRTGPQGAILGYTQGPEATLERVSLDGEELSFGLCEDLHYQATTVGGRQVDQLNLVKAERQQILETAGFATAMTGYMIAVAGASSRNRNVQAAGLIGLGIGIATIIFASAAIDPGADVRAWSMLPGQIYLAAGRAEPGREQNLSIKAHGAGDLSQGWSGVPVEEGVNLYWIRLLPGRSGGAWSPPEMETKTEGDAPSEPPRERSPP